MNLNECGRALVVIYKNGIKETILSHQYDGGEAYMGPVIRRAVAYAKTHYDSGDIGTILKAESAMEDGTDIPYLGDVKHVYYVCSQYNAQTEKKMYTAKVIHLKKGKQCTRDMLPELVSAIPSSATKVV